MGQVVCMSSCGQRDRKTDAHTNGKPKFNPGENNIQNPR